MANRVDEQTAGITFGRWRLVPVDKINWELCMMRAPRGTHVKEAEGERRWRREGRFYSYDTFHLALRYAADVELKDGCRDAAMAIEDALRSYEHILSGFSAGMAEAMRGRAGA